MTKILVTGGAGFIGSHLTQKLIDMGHKVMVVDSLKTIGGIPYINPKCLFLKGDIIKREILKKIKKWKPKIIYHLAAQSAGESAYDNPKFDLLTNGYGTYLLSDLAKEINVKLFIYTSSVHVYGSNSKNTITENSEIRPDSIYGISKYNGEMFVRQILYPTKIKTIIFRVFNIYGPGENLNYLKKGIVSIYSSYFWKNKPIIVKGSLKRFRDITYIDDCINILVKSLSSKNLKKNELFNLSSGEVYTVKKILENILFVNKKKKHKIIIKKGTKGDSFGFHTSNKKLKIKFNYNSFTSLKNGLKKYFMWINSLPKNKNLEKFHPLNLNNV